MVEIERAVAQDVESAMAFIMNEASKKFKLDTAPLFRIFLLQFSSEDLQNQQLIGFIFHHLIFDGSSVSIFLKEIDSLYRGVDLALLSKEQQFTEISQLERQQTISPTKLEFWNKTINPENVNFELPTDFPRSLNSTNVHASISIDLPVSLRSEIIQYSSVIFFLKRNF